MYIYIFNIYRYIHTFIDDKFRNPLFFACENPGFLQIFPETHPLIIIFGVVRSPF